MESLINGTCLTCSNIGNYKICDSDEWDFVCENYVEDVFITQGVTNDNEGCL